VKSLVSSPLARSRYLLAVVAGLLLAAAFPKIGIAGLAWIAPGFMAAAALGKRGWESFRIGYVAGLAHYLAMLYWLLSIPYQWHGIPLGPAAGWLSLSAFLALFPATWVWLVSEARLAMGTGRNPGPKLQAPALASANPSAESPTEEPPTADANPGSEESPWNGWLKRTAWALAGAAVWVALEVILARIFGGFPWDLLGVSQYQLVPLIQVASLTGVYGVSFILIWFSLSLVSAGVMIFRRPTLRSVWVIELFLPIIIVAALFNFGFRQVKHSVEPERTVSVTLVQPSIPQTLIWNPAGDEERFTALLHLCEQALTNKTDVLIWPESAIPKLLRWDRPTFEAVSSLARSHHVWLIVGADDMVRPHGSRKPEDALYYNSSFLINPEGKLVECYRKRSLVIFGEYIPLQHWLPFLGWFTPIQGGFTPGDKAVPFELPDLGVKTSVLICFEDVFPEIGRDSVEPDTDFLVNLTNDGWFGESAAQWQQAATSVFRAVENRVPLIRCTNTGLTCWIDAYGRMRDIFRDPSGSIYGAGFLTVQLPVLSAAERGGPTFYNRHGDWFGWSCVAVAGAMVATKLVRRLRARRTSKSEIRPAA
jgi:apolipoprotein N-acyltransferase